MLAELRAKMLDRARRFREFRYHVLDDRVAELGVANAYQHLASEVLRMLEDVGHVVDRRIRYAVRIEDGCHFVEGPLGDPIRNDAIDGVAVAPLRSHRVRGEPGIG